MSVGGKVTEVIIKEKSVYVDTDDNGDACAIYMEKNESSERIRPGDIVWWQSGSAYWTTADRKTVVERDIPRIGYSGVPRPKLEPHYQHYAAHSGNA